MSSAALGRNFEREIREQPAVWRRIAGSGVAEALACALSDPVVLVGSGSSLFVAQLGALALRRRAIHAQALAATEARLDHRAYEKSVVIAVSQSGQSADVLSALNDLHPRATVALTNAPDSPLARRADVVLDVQAGPEVAVPASKSVTASAAILLWAASIAGGQEGRSGDVLVRAADEVERWLADSGPRDVFAAAPLFAERPHVAVLGSDYGLPVAREIALKLKEASYVHAEGFAAGEFRHGSVSMVDDSFAVVGIVDADALPTVARPLREVQNSGAIRYSIGSETIDDVTKLGPRVVAAYNTLGWFVTGQLLALFCARARGIDCDSPRGLTKALVAE
jgi:glutamine---fructose-6-phosphate transaminase (isomerizing)